MSIANMEKQSQRSSNGGSSGGGSKRGTTMFVQADSTCNFRDLVQRLTGPSSGSMAPPPVRSPVPKPTTPKLYERRKYNTPNIEIGKPFRNSFQFPPMLPLSPVPMPCAMSPSGPYFISSSCLASPSTPSVTLCSSPPSILQSSPITRSPAPPVPSSSNKRRSSLPIIELNPAEEEKAIKEKRFYLHPSPRSKKRITPEPKLLTLFPLTSSSADSVSASKTTK